MNIFKFLIPLLLFFSSCSFKKEDTHPQNKEPENNRAAILKTYENIYSGTVDEVRASLAPLTKQEINDINFDGSSLLDAAIARGNPHILSLLLESGASPFSSNSKDHAKAYLRIHKLNSDMSDTLGNWVYLQWLRIFEKRDVQKIRAELESNQITCVDMLNLYSWYSVLSKWPSESTETVIEIAKNDHCLKNLSVAQVSLILTNELVGLLRGSQTSTDFLAFLSKSPNFPNALVRLKIEAGLMTIKPHSLVRIASSLESYKDNLDPQKIADLMSFFKEDKNVPINLHTEINKTLVKSIYSFNSQEEKEVVTSALNLINLGKSEGCFAHCNLMINPEAHEGL